VLITITEPGFGLVADNSLDDPVFSLIQDMQHPNDVEFFYDHIPYIHCVVVY